MDWWEEKEKGRLQKVEGKGGRIKEIIKPGNLEDLVSLIDKYIQIIKVLISLKKCGFWREPGRGNTHIQLIMICMNIISKLAKSVLDA